VQAFVAAANADCGAATSLLTGSAVSQDLIAGAGPVVTIGAPNFHGTRWDVRALYYKAQVAPGQMLTATSKTAGSGETPPVVLLSDCSSATALATGIPTDFFGAGPAIATFSNTGNSPTTIFVQVEDSHQFGNADPFTLSLRIE
jgi:hypothetical protein